MLPKFYMIEKCWDLFCKALPTHAAACIIELTFAVYICSLYSLALGSRKCVEVCSFSIQISYDGAPIYILLCFRGLARWDFLLQHAACRAMQKLFNYISGENDKKANIDMTAPVRVKLEAGDGPFCKSSFTMCFFVPLLYQVRLEIWLST